MCLFSASLSSSSPFSGQALSVFLSFLHHQNRSLGCPRFSQGYLGKSCCCHIYRFPLVAQRVNTLPTMQEPGSLPGSGSSPGEGDGNLLQYSCLEKSMGKGAWRRLQSISIVCDPSSLDPSCFAFLQPCLDKDVVSVLSSIFSYLDDYMEGF